MQTLRLVFSSLRLIAQGVFLEEIRYAAKTVGWSAADRQPMDFRHAGARERRATEPDGSKDATLLYAVRPAGESLEADVEGLTIYYAPDGGGWRPRERWRHGIERGPG